MKDTKYTFLDLDSMMLMGVDSHGGLKFIDDVPNGLDCNLKCPFCGSPFNAKNHGGIKAHHFAHTSGADCKQGHESVLPYFAKSIIDETKKIMLPRGIVYLNGSPLHESQEAVIKECSIIKPDNDKVGIVEITTLRDKKIAIVIFIKEEDAWARREYALKNYENVIAINLSRYKKQPVEVMPILYKALNENTLNRYWIKRYDELMIISKIKELAIKRNELEEEGDFFYLYYQKLKRKLYCLAD